MRALPILLLSELLISSAGLEAGQNLRSQSRKLQDSVITVDEYECKDKTNSFNTTVFVDFGSDVSNIANIKALESSFRESYSEVSFALCDAPFFRTITGVTVKPYSEENPNIMAVELSAECRDCSDETVFSGKGAASENSLNLETLTPVSVAFKTIDGTEVAELKQGDDESVMVMDTCVCPSGITPEERMPTEAEFYEIFQKAAAGLGLTGSFDLYEVESYECSAENNTLSSEVYIRIDGDLSTLDGEDAKLIEESFVTTYNDLNFAFCDFPYFRTIKSVTVDPTNFVMSQPNNRKLQGGSVNLDFSETILLVDPPLDANVLKLLVEMECKGCSELTPLFSFDTDGTDVRGARNSLVQDEPGTCQCPAHPDPLNRAPTTDEFQDAFRLTVLELQDNGRLTEVTSVEDVLEITTVDCSANETEFTSTVYVNLDTPMGELSNSERSIIEDSFLQSYNALTFSTCDAFFRNIEDARLVPTKSRRRALSNKLRGGNFTDANSTLIDNFASDFAEDDGVANVTKDEFPAVFNVRGKCRNCPVDENGFFQLFDDVIEVTGGSKRALAENKKASVVFGSSVAPSFSHRNLQQVCVCPADVPNDGTSAPNQEGFIDIFNERLAGLQKAEIINKQGATENQEGEIINNFGLVVDLAEAADLCEGGTFVVYENRYELSFSGDVDAVPGVILNENIRFAFNSERQGDCDDLISGATVLRRLTGVKQVIQLIDSLQLEAGSLFVEEATFNRSAAVFNELLAADDYNATLLSIRLLPPSAAPTSAPGTSESTPGAPGTPTHPSSPSTPRPTHKPTHSPSSAPSTMPSESPSSMPSSSPSSEPSSEPSSLPSLSPSAMPSNNQAMCNDVATRLTDSVILDYSILRVADLNLNLPFEMPDIWPLQEPATLIAAEEYLAAYNRLQKKVFCDPFRRKIVSVSCVNTVNKILSGSLCCTVHFKCFGNCEEFIYPDRDPIGAFYDQPGFEYPTDDSCLCDRDAPDRAPSASEHFDKLNDQIPYEILSFEYKGFSADKCPSH